MMRCDKRSSCFIIDFGLISFPIVYGCCNENVNICGNKYSKREQTF